MNQASLPCLFNYDPSYAFTIWVYTCMCVFCPQALLLHGSLPEEDQDGCVSFGDTRANAEQQLVTVSALALNSPN